MGSGTPPFCHSQPLSPISGAVQPHHVLQQVGRPMIPRLQMLEFLPARAGRSVNQQKDLRRQVCWPVAQRLPVSWVWATQTIGGSRNPHPTVHPLSPQLTPAPFRAVDRLPSKQRASQIRRSPKPENCPQVSHSQTTTTVRRVCRELPAHGACTASLCKRLTELVTAQLKSSFSL